MSLLAAIRDALASRRGEPVRLVRLDRGDLWEVPEDGPVPEDRCEDRAAYLPTGGSGPRGLEVRGGR